MKEPNAQPGEIWYKITRDGHAIPHITNNRSSGGPMNINRAVWTAIITIAAAVVAIAPPTS
ncbi:hypothetical protein [Nonomuraea basaltis]|uniref:hypothetical protein n=1 Tax=Nonomuraea basaltis TaxID=2495887 RepID=UPI00110C6F69|nr:hypothetical protein [Nonomuraea basaltis]TMR89103.1 hypothetical protein EJK15_62565 [Nonomuraea basaltis]